MPAPGPAPLGNRMLLGMAVGVRESHYLDGRGIGEPVACSCGFEPMAHVGQSLPAQQLADLLREHTRRRGRDFVDDLSDEQLRGFLTVAPDGLFSDDWEQQADYAARWALVARLSTWDRIRRQCVSARWGDDHVARPNVSWKSLVAVTFPKKRADVGDWLCVSLLANLVYPAFYLRTETSLSAIVRDVDPAGRQLLAWVLDAALATARPAGLRQSIGSACGLMHEAEMSFSAEGWPVDLSQIRHLTQHDRELMITMLCDGLTRP